MFFQRFHPASVDPKHFVGRDRDLRWLTEQLSGYLRLSGDPDVQAMPADVAEEADQGVDQADVVEVHHAVERSQLLLGALDREPELQLEHVEQRLAAAELGRLLVLQDMLVGDAQLHRVQPGEGHQHLGGREQWLRDVRGRAAQ
jgi:hypothetical protein